MSYDLVPYLRNFIAYAAGTDVAKLALYNSAKSKTLRSRSDNSEDLDLSTADVVNNDNRNRSRVGFNLGRSATEMNTSRERDVNERSVVEFIDFTIQVATYCSKLLIKLEQVYDLEHSLLRTKTGKKLPQLIEHLLKQNKRKIRKMNSKRGNETIPSPMIIHIIVDVNS